MKKKFALLFAVIVLALCTLCGCTGNEGVSYDEDRFVKVNSTKTTLILVDKETRVMYLWFKIGYAGGLTIMVDESGKPLLYGGQL